MARIDWPFKRMKVGETVTIWDVPPARVSNSAHIWARQCGAKVGTAQVAKDGRIGMTVSLLTAPSPKSAQRRSWPFKDLQPGEKTVLECPDRVTAIKALQTLTFQARYHGKKFKHKTVQRDDGTYLFLVKRLADDQT